MNREERARTDKERGERERGERERRRKKISHAFREGAVSTQSPTVPRNK
jgi:hypothetical protein